MNTNEISFVGNIVADPELRFTPSGRAKVQLTVANNQKWTDRQTGDQRERTCFARVEAWGSLAEHVAESLRKGDLVVVVGRLDQRSWETPQGEKRSMMLITANEISPSLRWATCTVVKAQRDQGPRNWEGGNNGGATAGYNDGGGYIDDEEPF